MNVSAVFLGGIVLGGILSAACGFDLFRSVAPPRPAPSDAERALARTKILLEACESSRSAALDDAGAASEAARRLAAETDFLREEAAEVSKGRSALELLLRERLVQMRQDSDCLLDEIDRAHRAVADGRVQLLELALDFFDRPRPEVDGELARRFLSVEPDSWCEVDLLRELVVRLRRHSPEILLGLGRSSDGSSRQRDFAGAMGADARRPGDLQHELPAPAAFRVEEPFLPRSP
jgi:hypothetical protein